MATLPAPEGLDLTAEIQVDMPDGEFVEAEDGGLTLEVIEEILELAEAMDFDVNLAKLMEESDLEKIGSDLVEQIKEDLESRREWEDTYKRGLDLLGFKLEPPRDQPFEGATSVVLPVIGEAVISFQARALAEFLPPDGPVQGKVIGEVTPELEDQARRVELYSNYWATEEAEEYFTEHDQMLFALPIAGTAFKKCFYDDGLGRVTARYAPAEDVIVSYGASSMLTATVTHRFRLTWPEVREYIQSGIYLSIGKDDGGTDEIDGRDEVREAKDEISGIQEDRTPKNGMHAFYEVHVNMALPMGVDPYAPIPMDAEGDDDGEMLPYVVVIHAPTSRVVSIRRNWKEGDLKKRRRAWFAPYRFLPSLSGIYGYGLIHLIGNLAQAATSIQRQIIDSGSFATVPALIKSAGVTFRDKDQKLAPGVILDVDVPASDLRAGIMDLPFKGPNPTMYQVLLWLVEQARRMAAIADVQVGDLQPNAPVGSTLAVLDNADRIQSAIHRRLHQAQRYEWKLLHRLFGEWLPDEAYPFVVKGQPQQVARMDFDDRVDVSPVTDPNITSKTARMAKARAHLEAGMQRPDLHDMRRLMMDYHKAIGESDPERLVPDREDEILTGLDPMTEFRKTVEGKTVRGAYGQNHQAHIAALTSQMTLYQNNAAGQAVGAQVSPLIQALIADHQLKLIEEVVASRLGLPVETLVSGEAAANPAFAQAVSEALGAAQAQAQAQAQQAMVAQKQQQEAEAVRIGAQIEQAKQSVRAQTEAALKQMQAQIDMAMAAMEGDEAAKDRYSREKMKAADIAQKDRSDRLDAATDRADREADIMLEREEQASDERLVRQADKTGGFTHT